MLSTIMPDIKPTSEKMLITYNIEPEKYIFNSKHFCTIFSKNLEIYNLL